MLWKIEARGLCPWRWRRGHCLLEASATRNKAQQRDMLLSIRRWYFMLDCLCICPVRLMAIFKDLSSSCKGNYICRNHLEKADEIIGQAIPPLFMISKGWDCFAVNCQKNLIQLYDRGIFFLFVTVNVISPLPRCYSRLAPFCFMKNNNTHACIVSALSMRGKL